MLMLRCYVQSRYSQMLKHITPHNVLYNETQCDNLFRYYLANNNSKGPNKRSIVT